MCEEYGLVDQLLSLQLLQQSLSVHLLLLYFSRFCGILWDFVGFCDNVFITSFGRSYSCGATVVGECYSLGAWCCF